MEICSISGANIGVDPACWSTDIDAEPPASQIRFLADEEAKRKFDSAPSILSVLTGEGIFRIQDFGCLFLCGGHGCVDDYLNNVSEVDMDTCRTSFYDVHVSRVLCNGALRKYSTIQKVA